MKALKKINNNAVICQDGKGRELIAFGKGIGFPKCPYELTDLSAINRTFYDVTDQQIALLAELDENILNTAIEITDKARQVLNQTFSDLFSLSLADHLQFAIARTKKGMIIGSPMALDIQNLYPEETKLAKWAVALIYRRLFIRLPEAEVANIAWHFINAGANEQSEQTLKENMVPDDLTEIIETNYQCIVDRNEFNYARFVSHIQYMMKRRETQTTFCTDNHNLFQTFKDEFPKTYQVSLEMMDYFQKRFAWNLSEEEQLYLMIHINRLVAREGL